MGKKGAVKGEEAGRRKTAFVRTNPWPHEWNQSDLKDSTTRSGTVSFNMSPLTVDVETM